MPSDVSRAEYDAALKRVEVRLTATFGAPMNEEFHADVADDLVGEVLEALGLDEPPEEPAPTDAELAARWEGLDPDEPPVEPKENMTRVTHTKTYTRIAFANPHLRCDECGQPVPAMRSDTNANLPCGHLGATSSCPSWGPVDGCSCQPRCDRSGGSS